MRKMERKLRKRQQKNKKYSSFQMEKNGYEILDKIHPGNSPCKTKMEK